MRMTPRLILGRSFPWGNWKLIITLYVLKISHNGGPQDTPAITEFHHKMVTISPYLSDIA
jgi:hypothetical protein